MAFNNSIGRGKPPLHTHSGRAVGEIRAAGLAKLARQRFEHALPAMIEGSVKALEHSQPTNSTKPSRSRWSATPSRGRRRRSGPAWLLEEEGAAGAKEFSLVQGKKQGRKIFRPRHCGGPARAKTGRHVRAVPTIAVRNEATEFSLVQGKKQGSEKKCGGGNPAGASAIRRGRIFPGAGKKAGKRKNSGAKDPTFDERCGAAVR